MKLDFLDNIDIKMSSLIDFANLKSGLVFPQNDFSSVKDLKEYKNKYYKGLPLLLPYNLKIYNYLDSNYFELSKKEIANIFFSTEDKNYIGIKKITYNGQKFTSKGNPKKKYIKIIKKINSYNSFQKKIVSRLAIKAPISCFEKYGTPHTTVNTIRFIINCAYNLNLNYEKNVHYEGFYEKHSLYGTIIPNYY